MVVPACLIQADLALCYSYIPEKSCANQTQNFIVIVVFP